MELEEYQKRAMTTCTDSSRNFAYMSLNLMAELGEFSGKVAKGIRKGEYEIGREGFSSNNLTFSENSHLSIDERNEMINGLKLELGDILWQLFGLCTILNFSVEEIAKMNLEKLASRKKIGTIIGEGDGIIR